MHGITHFYFQDCKRYVECSEYLAIIRTCPPGEIWNQTDCSCIPITNSAYTPCASSSQPHRRDQYVLARNNVCDYHLCKNGAGCLPISSYGYRCLCRAGYRGPYCDRYSQPNDVCANHNCRNGATCMPHIYFYKCICPSAKYTGTYCETMVAGGKFPVDNENPCRKNLCKNGAKCISISHDQYMCDCAMGFQPPYCEFKPCYFCNKYNTLACDRTMETCTCKKGKLYIDL